MKKYILCTFVIVLSLSLVRCDMERVPFVPDTSELAQSESGLQYMMNGAYRDIADAENGLVTNLFRVGIFGGDEVNLSGVTTDNMQSFNDLVRSTRNARLNQVWTRSYKSMFILNSIIESLQPGSSKLADQMLGEAHYLRGLTNFYLLMIFSKQYVFGRDNLGIPLKKTTLETDVPQRSSVGDSYDFVVEDLLKAEQLLDGKEFSRIRATKGAAQALLARVYLYMEDNAKALQYANTVISNSNYSLLNTTDFQKYSQFLPENNNETIFAFRLDENNYSAWYGLSSMFATIQGQGWGEMYVSEKYLQHIQMFPEDVRNNWIVPDYNPEDKSEPTVCWTWFDPSVSTYHYKIYNANLDADGNHISFNMDGITYNIEEETLNYGNNTYKKYFATINGEKQYLRKEYKMSNRQSYPKYFMYKVSLQNGKDHLYSPVISRLAEMYLIRAEVKAKTGDDAGALSDINIIRDRANAPVFTILPVGKTALDIVLEERWLELAYEGHRKFDLIRNQRPIDRRFPGVHLSATRTKQVVQPNDNDLVFFIPEMEINVSGLQQNP